MKRSFTFVSVILVVVLLMSFGVVHASDSEATSVSNQPMIGELAPAFSLLDVDGNTVSSDDLRGSYVVIHFAASW